MFKVACGKIFDQNLLLFIQDTLRKAGGIFLPIGFRSIVGIGFMGRYVESMVSYAKVES